LPKSRPRRRPSARRPSPRPATGGAARRTPPARPAPQSSGLRGAAERRSGPALVWLSGQHRLLVPLASLALLVGGAALPPPFGVPLLVVLLGLVGWLSYLSWPAVTGGGRAVRLVTVALVGALLVTRAAQL
jgi:hypothetical protein